MHSLLNSHHLTCDLILTDEKSDNQTIKLLSLALVNSDLSYLEGEKTRFLHAGEEKELETYTYAARRKSFLLGRLAAKKAIQAYTKIERPFNIFQIANGCMGQPYFKNMPHHLSISHSHQYGAALVGEPGLEFGMDIESIINKSQVSEDIFEPKELALNFPHCWNIEEQQLALWSCKESLVKFLKIGFTTSMKMLEISEIDYQIDKFLKVKFKHFHSIHGWILRGDDYILSICLPSQLTLKL